MTVRYANSASVPMALAVFLATDKYDYNVDPQTISATTLMKPLRQIILPSRLPETMGLPSLSSMMRNRIGSAVHDAIERAWLHNHIRAMQDMGLPQRVIDLIRINPKFEDLEPDHIPVYLEQRAEVKVGNWTVTGKFDIVFQGIVQDFKTANVLSYMKQRNAAKQIMQGSLYRWLNPKIVTADHIEIHHIFLDWMAGLVNTNPAYPKDMFVTQKLDLLSVHEVDHFVRQKLALIDQYWNADEINIPECDEEELWRSEPVFKYYKNPLSTKRSTKNFDTMQEASLRRIEDGSVGIVREVPGEVKACKYCPAFDACTQKDRLIAMGDLVL